MAHHERKDQPPAYMSEDYHESTHSGRERHATAPNHSTRASRLSQATATGTYTSQYLELTFSIMVRYGSTFEPVVIAIDEDYDTLLDDFNYIFRQIFHSSRSLGLKKMKVVWENGWKERWNSIGSRELDRKWDSTVETSNITAMLRLLKSQSGMSYIKID
ncbi:MAG: hypothetical protein ASARMPREDX12_008302 [Alectoria sarmentosa]|nr:MAG: hypothetical protein ASARMPREDX12_008302 [Alectoria sarmentosa]